jgi:hypothetical protein
VRHTFAAAGHGNAAAPKAAPAFRNALRCIGEAPVKRNGVRATLPFGNVALTPF